MNREIPHHIGKLSGDREIEVFVLQPNRLLKRELSTIFPILRERILSLNALNQSTLFVVSTFQNVGVDLIEFSPENEEKKELGLQTFLSFAEQLKVMVESDLNVRHGQCTSLVTWADPVTGTPTHGERTSMIFSESAIIESLRLPRFSFVHVSGPAGGCKVIQHPTWGCAVYPASLVCLGIELQFLIECIQRVIKE